MYLHLPSPFSTQVCKQLEAARKEQGEAQDLNASRLEDQVTRLRAETAGLQQQVVAAQAHTDRLAQECAAREDECAALRQKLATLGHTPSAVEVEALKAKRVATQQVCATTMCMRGAFKLGPHLEEELV